jgi:hypothetical protein
VPACSAFLPSWLKYDGLKSMTEWHFHDCVVT